VLVEMMRMKTMMIWGKMIEIKGGRGRVTRMRMKKRKKRKMMERSSKAWTTMGTWSSKDEWADDFALGGELDDYDRQQGSRFV
jgi:hypothetical protein